MNVENHPSATVKKRLHREKPTLQREDPRPRGPVLRTYVIEWRPQGHQVPAWSVNHIRAPTAEQARAYLEALCPGTELHVHTITQEDP